MEKLKRIDDNSLFIWVIVRNFYLLSATYQGKRMNEIFATSPALPTGLH